MRGNNPTPPQGPKGRGGPPSTRPQTDLDAAALLADVAGVVYRRRHEPTWTFEFLSDGARELLGASPDALTSGLVEFESMIHPRDLPRVRITCRHALESRTPLRLEYRLVLADGRTRWIADRGRARWTSDGAVEGFEGLLTDITPLKEAESRESVRTELEEMSARRAPLDVMVESLVAWVDERHESTRNIVHLYDATVRRFRLAAGPGIPAQFRTALAELPSDDTATCIGLAGSSGRRIVTRDFATATGCPQMRAFALSFGFASAWSEPIVADDGCVRGTWTQFRREIGAPGEDAVNAVRWATRVALDSIERRLAQDTHEAGELFHAATMSALSLRIAVVDADGVIVATNRAWRAFATACGLDCETVGEGASYMEVCERAMAGGDTNAAHMGEMIRRVLAGPCEEQTLGYFCRSTTAEHWFRCRVTRFPAPGPPRVVIAHEDITETHLALEAAQRHHTHFHGLFEFAPDALVMVDDNGLIVKVNRQTETLFGWAREDLVGHAIEVLMPPDARVRHVDQRHRFLQARRPRAMGEDRGVLRALRRDGTTFRADISLGPLETGAGRMVIAAIRDVTERTRMERRMRDALTALAAMNDTAVIFDVERLSLDFVNDAGLRLFGRSREELLTRSLEDFMSRESAASFRKAIPLRVGAEAAASVLTRLGNAEGAETPVEVSAQAVDGEDGQVRCIAVIRDITQRVAEERVARRSQRLESIGTLAGGVAHDLNNALTPIVMGIDALRADYPAESELLQTMETSARRATRMVRRLLTFARGAEGVRVPFALSAVLTELEAIVRATFPKSLRIRFVAERALPTVLGDPTQLHQVLMNLCVNARDAMADGGELVVEASRAPARLPGSAPNDTAGTQAFVRLRVSDTGAGIPPHHLEKIFDPFFTTKSPEKGTGLGLSTALGIIRAHGGLMDVESSLGRGTRFDVYLPVALEAESAETGGARRSGLRGDGRVVLMVDDEPGVRDMGRLTLETLGFEVVLADDGRDALRRFAERRGNFSLVLTDLSMPELDGMAFIQRFRTQRADLPVIVMSGHFAPGVFEQITRLGDVWRLDKPFSRDELAALIERVLGRASGGPRRP